jgi:uncharacterized protein YndB with AHSA1/START domain
MTGYMTTRDATPPTSPVGLTKDVGWEVGVSRTVGRSPAEAWEALTSAPALAVWLGDLDDAGTLPAAKGDAYRTTDGVTGELRSFRPGERLRVTYQPPGRTGARPTTLQVVVSPGRGAGPSAVVRFHQEHLADAGERQAMRAHWSAVLDRLDDLLGWRRPDHSAR